ncbi:LTA synthase family protein [Rhizobiaceae bacterium n13]|uniref:LTA synthase family protein n=1 Tax=Ferirhizobium litorale TaxID=2927786 RepID=A0AAE3QI44_9HYPH|nr:LTA synthase family protein [Fererhizobium litorale]MDI7863875.1 LTA synthase family protein [Fererhizobium litorale]MDI7924293.1 LTA synthase family protein [Fererhizobium litorale]
MAQSLAFSVLFSTILVFLVEWIARGSLTRTGAFLTSLSQPGLTTIAVLVLVLLSLDALLGRVHLAVLAVGPLLVIPAFFSRQKQLFLSDPLYPTDFLFGRQIMELMPVMVRDRPLTAVALVVGILLSVVAMVFVWRHSWRRLPRLSRRARLIRVVTCVPIIASFVVMMDYSHYSWVRDRLQVVPMMWDQKENYSHNGFLMAFAFNLPMAHVTAPKGFSVNAIDAIPSPSIPVTSATERRPDVIVLMSESFWDPTRLAGIKFSKDPMPTIRANQSGHVFSPEFGGMTANVEFEALTGFSNAFLPYGSIPYQQYVRKPVPSLATFFRSEGYAARSIHPFQSWFWNRSEVYKSFGFEEFRSEENLPPMEKRGIFASDDSLTKEIMRQADGMDRPFFFFAVTLQGHGPYEPNRYKRNTIGIEGNLPEADRATLATYTQGIKEADDSLKMLMDWAKKRDRETIIVLFGDHLPPLGTVYTSTGYMPQQVATRKASVEIMKQEHETPLVVWSSKTGPKKDIGTISPSLLPYQIVSLAGFKDPYYTGFLGRVQKKYAIVDRYQLVNRKDEPQPDWLLKDKAIDPLIRNYQYLQHDMIFGGQHGLQRFFPGHAWVTGAGF